MILLFLWINSVLAQGHDHAHLHHTVKEATAVVSKPVEVKPEFCPSPDDRAFINFSPDHLKDGAGFHGMLFFGTEDTFYISHLPMFHKPHDYQAIVEVRLPPKEKEKYLASAKKNGGYFTFAPDENFVLPKVMTEKSKIKGTLVQGHFERGGSQLLSVELDLVRVVLYKKLDEKEKKPAKEKYAIFGNGKEYFAAHVVSSRPGVDEVIPVPSPSVLTPEIQADIKKHGVLITDETVITKSEVSLTKSAKKFPYKEFYRETGDLE